MINLEVVQRAVDPRKNALDAYDVDAISWTQIRNHVTKLTFETGISSAGDPRDPSVDPNLFVDPQKMLVNQNLGTVLGRVMATESLRYRDGKWYTRGNPFVSPEAFLRGGQDPSFAEKLVVRNDQSIIVIGDLHSSIESLVVIVDDLVQKNILDDQLILKDTHFIVCTGDMVDRGPYSLEILFIMYLLKMRNPKSVFIANGNHEDPHQYEKPGEGMQDEMNGQLGNNNVAQIVRQILRFLPAAIFVDYGGEWLQFCHGGIHAAYDPKLFLEDKEAQFDFHGYDDPSSLVNVGLRWSDFTNRPIDTTIFMIDNNLERDVAKADVFDNYMYNIPRGGPSAGYVYTPTSTQAYLERNGLSGIVRGHQDFYPLGLIGRPATMQAIEGNGEYVPRVEVLSLEREYKENAARYKKECKCTFITEEDPSLFYVKAEHTKETFGASGGWESTAYPNVFKDFSVVTTSTATNARRDTLHFHTYSILTKT